MSKLKEKIKAALDLKAEKVAVPEWDCELYVQSMNGEQREAYEAATTHVSDENKVSIVHENMRAKLLVQCVHEVKEDGSIGEAVFENTPEDLALISAKSSAVLERLIKIAQRLSGIGKEAEEAIAKN